VIGEKEVKVEEFRMEGEVLKKKELRENVKSKKLQKKMRSTQKELAGIENEADILQEQAKQATDEV